MSGGFPLLGGLANGSGIADIGVASAGSPNVKGAWVTAIASTPSDFSALLVNFVSGGSGGSYSVDVGIGASGSEIIIAQDLIGCRGGTEALQSHFAFPTYIPAGTRIALRSQASLASQTIDVNVSGFDGSFTQPSAATVLDALGFSSAATQGTNIAPGVVGSKGPYATIISATSYDYSGIILACETGGSGAGYFEWIDVAVGGAGSEVIVIPDFQFLSYPTGDISPHNSGFLPISIPAGSRIAARVKVDSTTDRMGVVIYGVRQ